MKIDKNEAFIKMPISLIKYSEISVMDRLLYGTIANLTNRTGICTASNAYLADLFGVSIKTIERSFKVLREKKLIDTVNIYENDTKRILRRDTIIVPSNLSFDTLNLSNSTLKSEGRVPSNLSFDTLKSEGDNKINIKEDNKRSNDATAKASAGDISNSNSKQSNADLFEIIWKVYSLEFIKKKSGRDYGSKSATIKKFNVVMKHKFKGVKMENIHYVLTDYIDDYMEQHKHNPKYAKNLSNILTIDDIQEYINIVLEQQKDN